MAAGHRDPARVHPLRCANRRYCAGRRNVRRRDRRCPSHADHRSVPRPARRGAPNCPNHADHPTARDRRHADRGDHRNAARPAPHRRDPRLQSHGDHPYARSIAIRRHPDPAHRGDHRNARPRAIRRDRRNHDGHLGAHPTACRFHHSTHDDRRRSRRRSPDRDRDRTNPGSLDRLPHCGARPTSERNPKVPKVVRPGRYDRRPACHGDARRCPFGCDGRDRCR